MLWDRYLSPSKKQGQTSKKDEIAPKDFTHDQASCEQPDLHEEPSNKRKSPDDFTQDGSNVFMNISDDETHVAKMAHTLPTSEFDNSLLTVKPPLPSAWTQRNPATEFRNVCSAPVVDSTNHIAKRLFQTPSPMGLAMQVPRVQQVFATSTMETPVTDKGKGKNVIAEGGQGVPRVASSLLPRVKKLFFWY